MERQGKQAIVMVAIEPPAAAAEEASCSTSSTPVISEEEEEPLDGAILAEKILEQANELRSMQALQKRIEVLEKRGDQQKIKEVKRADKKAGSLAIARLQEKLDKAERRATDYCKRYTTSQFQLKARDKELSRLRAKSEKLEASSEKISKSNELLKGYVSRLESRLQASLDTKDDQQKIKEMSRRLASLSEDNERLQKHLSAQMEDNITMADSLNELRKRLDSDALAIGLESGEVLVELSNTKQICEQLEQKVEQRERDNQLLSEYANELRVKLADPPEPPPRDRTADDLALERRMEEVGRQVGELSATVRAQEERERELVRSGEEDRAAMDALRRELGEKAAELDALSFQHSGLRKKAGHLKQILKSLSSFCAQVQREVGELSSADASRLAEVEKGVLNMSADVLEPENRSFVKVLLQVVAASLEQRREVLHSQSSVQLLKGELKEISAKLARERAAAEQPSGQKTISLAYEDSKTPTSQGAAGFAFKTKSFAESVQHSSSRSEQTSRMLGDLERELRQARSIASRKKGVGEGGGGGDENVSAGQTPAEVVGSSTKVELCVRPEPSEAGSDTEFLSPMSRYSDPSPALDLLKSSRGATHFTPGKHTIQERLQILQSRFSKLNAESNSKQ